MSVENRMVVDSQWDWQQIGAVEEKPSRKGYVEILTDEFVPEDEAFEYAFERCTNGSEDEQKEFKAMLVEWFFSGNWVKED
jgi:hypothetical protein